MVVVSRHDVLAVEDLVSRVIPSRTPSGIVQQRREPQNRADVQVAIRPAVEPLADARVNELSTVEWHSAHVMPTLVS